MKKQYAEIEKFVMSGIDNFGSRAYIEVKDIDSLYVRIAHHNIDGKIIKTFDIANIEVSQEQRQTGIFKSLLKYCEKMCADRNLGLYVECVLNPHLSTFLQRRGYFCDGQEISPSYGLGPEKLKELIDKENANQPSV